MTRSRPSARFTVLLLVWCAASPLGQGCSLASPPGEEPRSGRPAGEPHEGAVEARPDPAVLLPKGRMPFEGILTGGQPADDQLERIRDLGYRTIVNLRAAGEEGSTRAQDVEALGMTYVALPIDGAADITPENARKLATLLETAQHPLVVHCSSGNRVGALFALKAFAVDGKRAEEALELGRAAGLTRLEADVREKLGLPASAP